MKKGPTRIPKRRREQPEVSINSALPFKHYLVGFKGYHLSRVTAPPVNVHGKDYSTVKSRCQAFAPVSFFFSQNRAEKGRGMSGRKKSYNNSIGRRVAFSLSDGKASLFPEE